MLIDILTVSVNWKETGEKRTLRVAAAVTNFDWQDTLSNQLCSSALCTTSVVSECNFTRGSKRAFFDLFKQQQRLAVTWGEMPAQGGLSLNLITHLHHAWPASLLQWKNRDPVNVTMLRILLKRSTKILEWKVPFGKILLISWLIKGRAAGIKHYYLLLPRCNST